LTHLQEDDKPQKETAVVTKLNKKQSQSSNQSNAQNSLRNTFGWARVDVLTMLIVCTFLASLCFSAIVESFHTMFHVSHHDHLDHKEEYHTYTYEICILMGALGLVLNGLSYLLIGGFTSHQGNFLHLTSDGNVYVLDRVVTDSRKPQSSETRFKEKSKLFHELSRDACSEY
jgi:uncharacterized BrkB/YihY/UPF0761 family membrane protein